ncbi:UNVERIFIED_CONTAM: hypothetical protein RMT77_011676 [Armadillidium vulgare]
MHKFFQNIKDDFLNKKFMPLKVIYFLINGGLSTLFPFLTIHARSLGITGSELGIIYAVLPITGLFGSSCSGLIADKLGNFRVFVSFSIALAGLTALLFIAVPQGRIEKTLPVELPVMVDCSTNSSGTVQPQLSCTLDDKYSDNFINITKCSVNCKDSNVNYCTVHNNIQGWCSGIADCEIINYTNVCSNQINNKVIGNGSADNETHYIFNNFSMPISIDKSKKSITITELFCPDRNTRAGEEISKCHMKCEALALSKDICKNEKYLQKLNPVVTVISYIVVRLSNGLFVASSFTLFESAVLTIVTEHNGDLGLQRIYGNIGQLVMTPISGSLIDHFSRLNNMEDYRPCFYMYCIIQLVCALSFLWIDLNFKQPSESVMKDFKGLITQPIIIVFLLYILSTGTCYGFIETFLFWLLEDLGADRSLMGITVTIGSLFGIPLLLFTPFFTEKVGYVNTLTICCLFYVIRFGGYSVIKNPWIALPFEALESFTVSLLNVVTIEYAGKLSSPTTLASMQGLLSGTYLGIGKSSGSLIGGVMIDRLGNAATYQILAAVAGVTAVLYFIVNKIFFRTKKETSIAVIKSPTQVAEINSNVVSAASNRRPSRTNAFNTTKTNGVNNLAFIEEP